MITVVKPIKWEGAVIIKAKNKEAIRKLGKKFKEDSKKENVEIEYESSKGKLSKVI